VQILHSLTKCGFKLIGQTFYSLAVLKPVGCIHVGGAKLGVVYTIAGRSKQFLPYLSFLKRLKALK
jgi:hypothetical protein